MQEIDLKPEDIYHKSQLNRLLIEIVDDPLLGGSLAFKGGTCAAMLGYLDRFSVDLDFDQLPRTNTGALRNALERLFDLLGFEILVAFDQVLMYQLRYPNEAGKRNKLKISSNSILVPANQYKVQYFPEVDRLINSQTIETMFANKLVALMDRYDQHGTVAARDLYDIHYFFIQGYGYIPAIIEERTNLSVGQYLAKLQTFIKDHITQRVINEDLNSLLPNHKFQRVRKILLPETLALLSRERSRVLNAEDESM